MRRAFLVAGLGYGDEGKGATVDYLTWKHGAGLIVRYNGGSQAGHNVVTPDGRWHVFQQFGAGMFHPGVRTHLSRFMLINPLNQMLEEKHLREVGITDAWKRTTVDPDALIVTPFHREVNRANSPTGTNSCGQGIGVCREMHLKYGDQVLFAGDLVDKSKTREKLRCIVQKAREILPELCRGELNEGDFAEDMIDWCVKEYSKWPVTFEEDLAFHIQQAGDVIIFEGAQGVLLDEVHGEEGFNTWTNTTFDNAHKLLGEANYLGKIYRVGVTRTYHTRHGAGPFPTEDPTLTYPEPHNEEAGYQGKFRRGHFDHDLFDRAIKIVGGIDILALNHLDVVTNFRPAYEHNIPVVIRGFGPTYKDRTFTGGD